jgi:dATP pyrophosphohydrolase
MDVCGTTGSMRIKRRCGQVDQSPKISAEGVPGKGRPAARVHWCIGTSSKDTSMAASPHDHGAGLTVRCTMVSVIVLHHCAGRTRMLALRRSSHYLDGVWSYVAGHVVPGEAGWQTALRELDEETGLAPRALYATSFCEQFYARDADCIELVPAFVAHVDADAAPRLNAEHSAFRWVSFAAAARMFPFGSQRELIAHVEREFVLRPPSPFLRIAL